MRKITTSTTNGSTTAPKSTTQKSCGPANSTPDQNAKLLAYFKDRKIWLVTPDTDNTYLEPYTPPDAPLVPEQ